MKHIKAIILIFIILLVFIVAVQNYSELTSPIKFGVDLIFFEYETSAMPLAFVAIITFIIGIVFMGVYRITETFRLRGQIKSLIKEAKERDEELNSLRNLPVTTEDMVSEQTPELK